ncbi:MAG TPA: hypothetical protein VJ924_00975 [Alphaproteobacteria bacterium]|nr:hypothetical protein [Alphaproteobacteria bacterium]
MSGAIVRMGQVQEWLNSPEDVKRLFGDATAHITHRNGATQKAYFAVDGIAQVSESDGARSGRREAKGDTIGHNPSSQAKCRWVAK